MRSSEPEKKLHVAGLRTNLAWTTLGQVAFFAIQFGGSVLLARLLRPREMGVYAVAAAIIGLLAVLQGLGLRSYLIREPQLDDEHLAATFTINGLFSLLLAALIAGAALVAKSRSGDAGVGSVLLVLSLFPLIEIFEFLPSACLERAGRFAVLVRANLLRNLTATAVTLVLAYRGWSYLSVAWGQIAGAISASLMTMIVGREHVQHRLSLNGWRRIASFGVHIMTMSSAGAVATRASELLLGKIGGLDALGLYNRASTLTNLFFGNLHLVIGRVLFVDLADRKRAGASLREPYLRILEISTAALWPAFAGLAVLSRPLFALMYGERWLAAAGPFAILSCAAILQIAITMTVELFAISRETGRQMRLELFRSAASTAFFAAGATFGITGAALGRLADAALAVFLYRRHIERMTDTSLADALPIYARSAVLTALAVGPSSAIIAWCGANAQLSIWQVAAGIVGGVACWASGLIALRHPLYREITRLRRRRLAPA